MNNIINQFEQAKNNPLNQNSDIISLALNFKNKIDSLKSLINIQKDIFQRNNITGTQVSTIDNNIITTLIPYYTICLFIEKLYSQKI